MGFLLTGTLWGGASVCLAQAVGGGKPWALPRALRGLVGYGVGGW